jgi:hypothetical protein
VLTWNLNMANGTTETILVNVDGKIPAKTACDSIRFLSGPWSAVYNTGTGAQKSDYTGRVSIQVTCPLRLAFRIGKKTAREKSRAVCIRVGAAARSTSCGSACPNPACPRASFRSCP